MHQFLFYVGDFPIRSYGAILSLSIFLATGVGYFMAKVDGRGYEKFLIDIGLIGGFFGLLGARLWDVFFFDWDYYQNHLSEILNVWQGGMAVQGGIILGVTAGAIYAKTKRLDVIHLADLMAPAIVLGQALGTHLAHRLAAISELFIPTRRLPIALTEHNRFSLPRSGSVS